MAQLDLSVKIDSSIDRAREKLYQLVDGSGKAAAATEKLVGKYVKVGKAAESATKAFESTEALKKVQREVDAVIKKYEAYVAETKKLVSGYEATYKQMQKAMASGRGYSAIMRDMFIAEQRAMGITKKAAEERYDAMEKYKRLVGSINANTNALKEIDNLNAVIAKAKEGMKVEEALKRVKLESANVAEIIINRQIAAEQKLQAIRNRQTASTRIAEEKQILDLVEKGYSLAQAESRVALLKQGYNSVEISQLNALLAKKKAMRDADELAISDAKKLNAIYEQNQREIKEAADALKRMQVTADLVKGGLSRTAAGNVAGFSMKEGVTKEQIAQFTKLNQEIDALNNKKERTSEMGSIIRNAFSFNLAMITARLPELGVEILKIADTMKLLESRIKLVMPLTENYADIQSELVDISIRTSANLQDVARLFQRLSAPMRALGKDTKDILGVTEAFGSALLISGATVKETESAILQFSQAMASGKLAGDEFRSVSEAAPALLQAIADGANVARSELKRMSSDGKLTTEFVTNALANVQDKLNFQASLVPKGVFQSLTDLKTKFAEFVDAVNDATKFTEGLAGVIKTSSNLLGSLTDVVQLASPAVQVFADANLALVEAIDEILIAFIAYKASSALVSVSNKATAASFTVMTLAANATTVAIGALSLAMRGLTAILNLNPLVLGFTALSVIGYKAYESVRDYNKESEAAAKSSGLLATSLRSANNEYEAQVKAAQEMRDRFPDVAGKYEEQARRIVNASKVDGKIDASQLGLDENAIKTFNDFVKQQEAGFKKIKDSGKFSSDQIIQFERSKQEAIRLTANAMIIQSNIAKDMKAIGVNTEEVDNLRNELSTRKNLLTVLKQVKDVKVAESIAKLLPANATQEQIQNVVNGYKDQAIALKGVNAEIDKYNEKSTKQKDIPKEKNQYAQRIVDLNRVLELSNEISEKMVRDIASEEEYGKRYGKRLKVAKEIASLQKKITAQESVEASFKEIEVNEKVTDLIAQGLTLQEAQAAAQLIKNNYVKEEIALNIVKAQQLSEINQLLQLQTIEAVKQQIEFDKTRDSIQKIGEAVKNDLATTDNPFKALEGLDLSKLFGDGANPFDELVSGMSSVVDKSQELKNQLSLLGKDDARRAILQKQYTKDQLKNYANITGAAKGFFKEGSRGYRTLETAEKAFRAVELAEALANFAVKTGLISAETVAYLTGTATKSSAEAGFTAFTVIQKGIQAAASGVAALASSMAGLPFPLNLAAFAATAAVLAGIGVSIGGKGGKKSGSFKGSEAKTTGTVFGDKNKESESIKKSIDILAANSKIELPISSAMLASLKNIENSIAGVGTLLVRASTTGNAPGQSLASSVKGGNGTVSDVVSGIMGLAGAAKTLSAFAVAGGFGGSLAAGAFGALGGSSLAGAGVGTALGIGAGGGTAAALGTGVVGLGVALVSTLVPAVGEAFNKVIEESIPVLNKLTFGLSDALIFKPIGKLFGSIFGKTKVSVKAQGLYGGKQSLGDVLSEGFDLKEFVDVKIKKSGLFGSSSKKKTIFRDSASKELENQFTMIFAGFAQSILLASSVLGRDLDDVSSKIESYVVDIGKINLKGLSGEEIQKKLQAIFGQQADLIAQAALSGLEDFQKVGEGYFETVVRVASGVEQAAFVLERFNINAIAFGEILNKQGDVAAEIVRQSIASAEGTQGIIDIVNVLSGSATEIADTYEALLDVKNGLIAIGVDARNVTSSLIRGAGGLDKLQEGLDAYFKEFLSPQEQAIELTARLAQEFAKLNLVLPSSIEGFKDLVSTVQASGNQEQLGGLLALADDFSNLLSAEQDAIDEANKRLEEANENISRAENALRDVYNREKSKFENIIKSFRDIASELRKYRENLRLTNGLLSPEEKLKTTQTNFRDALSKAMAGDQDALKSLTNVSKDYLDASKDYYASSEEYFKILSEVETSLKQAEGFATAQGDIAQQQLDALTNQVSQLIELNDTAVSIEQAISNLRKAQQETAAANAGLTAANSEFQLQKAFAIAGAPIALGFNTKDIVKAISGEIAGFDTLDINKDQAIATEELTKVLKGRASEKQITALQYITDSNGDKLVSAIELTNSESMTTTQLASQGVINQLKELGASQVTAEEFSSLFGSVFKDITSVVSNIVESASQAGVRGTSGMISLEQALAALTNTDFRPAAAPVAPPPPSQADVNLARLNVDSSIKSLNSRETGTLDQGTVLAINSALSGTDVKFDVKGVTATPEQIVAGLSNLLGIDSSSLSQRPVAELKEIAGKSGYDENSILNAIVKSAMGNVFSMGNVVPFAKGGMFTNSIATRPTLAPMSLFGEAGPEAIMPLSRGRDGSLGVRIVGGRLNDNGVSANTAETNRQLAALVRLQQAANQQIIQKISDIEDRLDGIESKTRLQAAS